MSRVAEENRRPGSTAWWQGEHAPAGAVEGYAAQTSVVAGDALGLHVATRPPARYRTTVYRLGWYDGAGGRLMARLPVNAGLARDAPLPDLQTGIVAAGWPETDRVLTDESWVSGQYVAVLELISGPHAGTAARIQFVLRTPPGDAAPILVQTPVNTAQAYNHWGGRSLYRSNSEQGIAAVKVSFDRPVPAWEQANLNARAPFVYELPLIRWLEREGLEADYQTDVDTHRHPHTLVGRRVMVSAGHDEYWSGEMRDAAETALADGTSLAFMGANTCYWQVRYEDDERTLVEYRDGQLDPEPDPALATVRFRDLSPPRPERTLIGQQYQEGLGHPDEVRDFRFVPGVARDPWATGVELDPERPLRRLVGYEWDTLDPATAPPGTVPILHADTSPVAADCVRWTAPSGAQVFAAGSLQLVWGLDDWAAPGCADARLARILRTGFAAMLSGG
jgi:hypothetical protein